MNTQNALKAVLLVTVLAMMTACNRKSESSNDFASRIDGGSVVPSTDKTFAYCNSKTQGGLSVKIKSFIGSNGQIRNDLLQMKIVSVPSDFTSTGSYIQMYRWKANSSSQTYLDPTPLQYRADLNTGQALVSSDKAIYWNLFQANANAVGMSNNPTEFFKYTSFVVDIRDTLADFDVIKVVYYNSSNQAVVDMDLLIPIFHANPVSYATESTGTARAAILQSLHPFVNMTNQGWDTTHYQSVANSYCF